jgi:hypothetical protein
VTSEVTDGQNISLKDLKMTSAPIDRLPEEQVFWRGIGVDMFPEDQMF